MEIVAKWLYTKFHTLELEIETAVFISKDFSRAQMLMVEIEMVITAIAQNEAQNANQME